jgi:hypothetical protein
VFYQVKMNALDDGAVLPRRNVGYTLKINPHIFPF